MSDANSNSATGSAGEDHLNDLEQLAGRIADEIRDRDGEKSLQSADEAAKAAKASIALLEHLTGFVALVQGSIDVDERSRLERDLQELARAGGVVSAASTADALVKATEELRSLSSRVELVERPIARAWQQLLETTFVAAGSLGSVLLRIPETREIGKEFNDLHKAAMVLKMRQGTADALAAKFSLLEGRLEALRSNLSRIGAEKEVTRFLEAVSEQRATLALLTREVRDWLKERDALNLFRVTL